MSDVSTEEELEEQPQGGALKRRRRTKPVEQFTPTDEISDLIPAFRAFFIEEYERNPDRPIRDVASHFEALRCRPIERKFNPTPAALLIWSRKWAREIEEARKAKAHEALESTALERAGKKDLALTDESGKHHSLENRLDGFGHSLLKDAEQMLEDDRMNEDVLGGELLVKRRAYIVSVFANVTRLVQGAANIKLKERQDKRDNANFIMGLLGRASAGQLSREQISQLRASTSQAEDRRIIEAEPIHVETR